MIKEGQNYIHMIRLIVILFTVIPLTRINNKVNIEAKTVIDQSEISLMNTSLYYERKVSYESLIMNPLIDRSKIQLISNDSKQIIDIPDIELKKQINLELGKLETDDITLEELQSLSSLFLSSKNISNIEGLQYATNLKMLWLTHNQISDISPLAKGSFDNLTTLYLSSNQISDVSPLAEGGFDKLETLYLDNNHIEDINGFGNKCFPQLRSLQLWSNRISDISALSTVNFPKLSNLSLSNQEVLLETTEFYNGESLKIINPIKYSYGKYIIPTIPNGRYDSAENILIWDGIHESQDLSFSFSKRVYIGQINSTFSGIVTLPVKPIEKIIDIPDNQLKKQINLKLGKLETSEITLSELKSLSSLYLSNKNISNIEGLQYATNLIYLQLDNNQISDISPLGEGNFNYLGGLSLSNNQISDISPLGKVDFNYVTELCLDNNQIGDISRLSFVNFPSLMSLTLHGQTILLEDVKIYNGQSIKIVNPIKDISGEYVTPTILNGFYDSVENHLIWDDIYQSQDVNFNFSKEIYFDQGRSIFSGNVTVPIRVHYSKEDVNQDRVIDEQDLKFISKWYNVTSDNPIWNLELDLNRDGIIDLFDLIIIANKIEDENK